MTPATDSYYLASAAATVNNTVCTDAAGVPVGPVILTGIQGENKRASTVYIDLFDKNSAPAAGTDTPKKKLACPANQAFAFDFPSGFRFATGLGFALTTGSALNDTGALTAGDIVGLNLDFAR